MSDESADRSAEDDPAAFADFEDWLLSRGPESAESAREGNAALDDQGPLDTGPLGPLDQTPRVDFTPGIERLRLLWGAETETGTMRCPIPEHKSTALIECPPGERGSPLAVLMLQWSRMALPG